MIILYNFEVGVSLAEVVELLDVLIVEEVLAPVVLILEAHVVLESGTLDHLVFLVLALVVEQLELAEEQSCFYLRAVDHLLLVD